MYGLKMTSVWSHMSQPKIASCLFRQRAQITLVFEVVCITQGFNCEKYALCDPFFPHSTKLCHHTAASQRSAAQEHAPTSSTLVRRHHRHQQPRLACPRQGCLALSLPHSGSLLQNPSARLPPSSSRHLPNVSMQIPRLAPTKSML